LFPSSFLTFAAETERERDESAFASTGRLGSVEIVNAGSERNFSNANLIWTPNRAETAFRKTFDD